MANALGLGSVWCAIYPHKGRVKAIKKALGLPLGISHSPRYMSAILVKAIKAKSKINIKKEMLSIYRKKECLAFFFCATAVIIV